MLLVIALVAAVPGSSLAARAGAGAGAGAGTGTSAGGHGSTSAGTGTGVTTGERTGGAAGVTTDERIGERNIAREGGEFRERAGFGAAPVGGVVLYSLSVYNGDQVACYNACVASGQYPMDQCQSMCTQW